MLRGLWLLLGQGSTTAWEERTGWKGPLVLIQWCLAKPGRVTQRRLQGEPRHWSRLQQMSLYDFMAHFQAKNTPAGGVVRVLHAAACRGTLRAAEGSWPLEMGCSAWGWPLSSLSSQAQRSLLLSSYSEVT